MADTIQITKDSYVRSTLPDTNYGTDTVLPCYYTSSEKTYVFIQPDSSSITNIEDVVDIYMVISTVSAYGGTLRTQRPSSAWAESTITYNNMPSVYMSYDERTIPANYDGWQYWDLTAYYSMERIGKVSDYGFRLDRSDLYESYPITFRSSDFSSTGFRPYLRVRYLDDDFGGYATDSGSFMTNISRHIPFFGNAIVYNSDSSQSSPYTAQCNVSPPWTSSYMGTEYLDEGESVTYSTSITGGTEYFIVENTSTAYNGEIGYYPIFTVVWYREYGERYVKTDGDDNDNGLSWDYAFASIEKGFEATPDGCTLYIESGLYSETLANIGLASGNTEINIVPMNESHISSDYSAVAIGTGTVSNIGAITSNSTATLFGHNYLTIIDTQHVVPSTTNIQLFDSILYSSSDSVLQVRIVSYNLSGGIYTPINFGEWSQDIAISGVTKINKIYSGVDVTAYDTIGLQIKYISGVKQFGWRSYYTATDDTYLWVSDTEMDGSLDTSNTEATYTGYRTSMILHYFT